MGDAEDDFVPSGLGGLEVFFVAWIRMDWRKWFQPLDPFTKKALTGAWPSIVEEKVKKWRNTTGFYNKDGELLILPLGETPWFRMSK